MRRLGSRLLPPVLALCVVSVLSGTAVDRAASIPLPEHPRPDFEREEWVNLNGDWAFRFDPSGAGETERWFETAPDGFPLIIHVPFSWGSKLSGVADEADVAWYARHVRVPPRGVRILQCGGLVWRAFSSRKRAWRSRRRCNSLCWTASAC